MPRARLRNPDGVDPDSDAHLGNPDGVAPDSNACSVSSGEGVPTPCTRGRSLLRCSIFSGYPTSGILSSRRFTFSGYFTSGIPSANVSPSPNISHPDGRGGRFNFPGQTCPDPLIALTWRVFLSVYNATEFLLKLPDIFDQLFEIFCFRYLMSKSPNSPCNPPIIGFLSL